MRYAALAAILASLSVVAVYAGGLAVVGVIVVASGGAVLALRRRRARRGIPVSVLKSAFENAIVELATRAGAQHVAVHNVSFRLLDTPRRRRLGDPGSFLQAFTFMFRRRTREDIEAIITDLWLDAEEMRSRGFSRRWVFFIMKVREFRELVALLWQWIRETWAPRPGRGR